jgi:hypothetical protein
VTREEFLDLLARLRRACVGNVRAPHKQSNLYVARSDAGRRAVDDLSGQPLLAPGQVSRWSNWCTSAGITGRSSSGLALSSTRSATWPRLGWRVGRTTRK